MKTRRPYKLRMPQLEKSDTDGHKFIVWLIEYTKSNSVRNMCMNIDMSPSAACKIMGGGKISPELIVHLHEELGISIKELKAKAGTAMMPFRAWKEVKPKGLRK